MEKFAQKNACASTVLGLSYRNNERIFIKETGEVRVNTMTQLLKTSPKTSQRPLFLRKRGFLTHKKGGKPPKIPGAVAYRGNLFQKKFTGKERDPETGLYYYGARYWEYFFVDDARRRSIE
jgi:hypothetical protein